MHLVLPRVPGVYGAATAIYCFLYTDRPCYQRKADSASKQNWSLNADRVGSLGSPELRAYLLQLTTMCTIFSINMQMYQSSLQEATFIPIGLLCSSKPGRFSMISKRIISAPTAEKEKKFKSLLLLVLFSPPLSLVPFTILAYPQLYVLLFHDGRATWIVCTQCCQIGSDAYT